MNTFTRLITNIAVPQRVLLSSVADHTNCRFGTRRFWSPLDTSPPLSLSLFLPVLNMIKLTPVE